MTFQMQQAVPISASMCTRILLRLCANGYALIGSNNDLFTKIERDKTSNMCKRILLEIVHRDLGCRNTLAFDFDTQDHASSNIPLCKGNIPLCKGSSNIPLCKGIITRPAISLCAKRYCWINKSLLLPISASSLLISCSFCVLFLLAGSPRDGPCTRDRSATSHGCPASSVPLQNCAP